MSTTASQSAEFSPSPEMDEATRRALALYESRLKAVLEPQHNGEFVAIHPDSEDYVVAPTSGEAMRAMYRRHTEGQVLLHLIGPAPVESGLAARMLGTRLPGHPLDKVFGIFKDEPLMDALMERVHEDHRMECETDAAE